MDGGSGCVPKRAESLKGEWQLWLPSPFSFKETAFAFPTRIRNNNGSGLMRIFGD
ncbi:hypothetical protein AtDm6_1533 [Acetobacter tropicalis]|uniref:Uncharacterized protein n=1 Tax=Acetobacter tropicalis TaxID=104102 RepID=A0A094ZNQ7_9PROT|nr:hypothetical protein AtDm6_1533 [Acetobacter tropicalis]